MNLPSIFSLRNILVAVLALAALYLCLVAYRSGGDLLALALLVICCLGFFVYLNPRAETYRYLFPGLLAFALFVIFPICLVVYISLTQYSANHLLSLSNVLLRFKAEVTVSGSERFNFWLHRQDNGKFVLELKNEKKPEDRYVSGPIDLVPGEDGSFTEGPFELAKISPSEKIPGEDLDPATVARQRLYQPLRNVPFKLPGNLLVGKTDLEHFVVQKQVWKTNSDGSLANQIDGSVIRPDFREGRFVDQNGEQIGPGFRSFVGLDNYIEIITNPRIQGPFFRIFVWTLAFSILSVLGTFTAGILLAVILEWRELRFKKLYRTLLILPYAVPGILSLLILRGLFNQEFGAVNEVLKAVLGFAPAWETDPWAARAMILLVNVWLGYPYMMLICTGMLQSIPSTIYESAAIEGSSPVISFFRLTLPLVLPPLFPVLVASFAFSFNNFALIYLLTAGAPRMPGGGIAGETDILVTYTYNLAFRDAGANYGLASAIATLLFVVVGTLSWINLRFTLKRYARR
ncbi:MAG: maltose ABC transporter permease MalF [Verrucomicrobia bacterium]|nr:maltose ABC transporter permease MalF [Verrucomicrobiota bacterium]